MEQLFIVCLLFAAAFAHGGHGGGDNFDVRAFQRDNRVPGWALRQSSIWGDRFFFKRSADNFDVRAFERANRVPGWALRQSSIWGDRFFFKRSADNFDVRAFERANRVPGWALRQSSIWGDRFFFKREAEQKLPEGSCVFNSTSSILECFSSSSVIECPAEAIVDTIRITTFSSFAISATPSGDVKKPESVKFSLFPSKLSKNGWKHSKIRDSVKKVHEYALFSSQKFDNKGLRVRDDSCWKKIVTLLTSVKTVETIKLGTPPGRVDDAKIFGKIFIDRI